MYRNTKTSMGLFDNLVSSPYTAKQGMRMKYEHGGNTDLIDSTESGGVMTEEEWKKANPHVAMGSYNPNQWERLQQGYGHGYGSSYADEQKKRDKQIFSEKINPFMSGGETDEEKEARRVKNPWEEGYTGWYDDDEQFTSGRDNEQQYWFEQNGGTQGLSSDDGKGTSTPDPNQSAKMRVTPSGGGGGGGGQSSAGLFGDYGMAPIRSGGSTGGGGGAQEMGASMMEDNRFMDMNPYIAENVLAFNYGGKIPKYDNGGATHTMPDGAVHPGANHQEYMAMMSGNRGTMPSYNSGGTYTQKANEMIAMNQISNLMGGVNSPYTADKGMKYKYNHGGQHTYNNDGYGLNEGGITIQEANTSGKRYVINQDGSATILPYQGDLPGAISSRVDMDPALLGGGTETPSASLPLDRQVMSRMSPPKDIYKETRRLEDQYAPIAPPMANQGMKMRKRYTQGGRF